MLMITMVSGLTATFLFIILFYIIYNSSQDNKFWCGEIGPTTNLADTTRKISPQKTQHSLASRFQLQPSDQGKQK